MRVSSDSIYRAGAAAFLVAAIYHLAASLIPRFGDAAYSDAYPLWRHALFIAVNVSAAWLLLKRIRWAVWVVALVTAQIYYGHGRYAWNSWVRDSRIEWIDLLTTLGATLLLILLIAISIRSARTYRALPRQY